MRKMRSAPGDQIIVKLLDPPDDAWLTRGTGQGLICKGNQRAGVKARGQPMQTQRGDPPIAIAPGPAQQVDLARQTFSKCRTQFGEQFRVVPCNCRQRLVQSSGFVGHGLPTSD